MVSHRSRWVSGRGVLVAVDNAVGGSVGVVVCIEVGSRVAVDTGVGMAVTELAQADDRTSAITAHERESILLIK